MIALLAAVVLLGANEVARRAMVRRRMRDINLFREPMAYQGMRLVRVDRDMWGVPTMALWGNDRADRVGVLEFD